jgi:hypothetical protein
MLKKDLKMKDSFNLIKNELFIDRKKIICIEGDLKLKSPKRKLIF